MNTKRVSNNQAHELGLFQTLVTRLHELEGLGVLERLHAEFWGQTGVSLTIRNPENELQAGYTVYLNPQDSPLRVTYGEGNGPHQPKSFKKTHAFLAHAIAEIEKQIEWAKMDQEDAMWNAPEIRYFDQPREEEDGEPEIFTEVAFTEGPGGHKGYE